MTTRLRRLRTFSRRLRPFWSGASHYDRLSPETATALEQTARQAAERTLLDVNRSALDTRRGGCAGRGGDAGSTLAFMSMSKTSRMPNRRVASALAGLVLLGGCARRSPPITTVSTPAAGVCRVGPDGGPIADKGIGGTGGVAIADRGIGGTGGPQIADRGIGGTGIIAVISGFASLCLAGQEVALPADTPILLGSEPVRVCPIYAPDRWRWWTRATAMEA